MLGLDCSNFIPSGIHISTMTVGIKTNLPLTNVTSLDDEMVDAFSASLAPRYDNISLSGCREIPETKFMNCKILKFKEADMPLGGKKSVKLFSNGALQITGCKTIEESTDIAFVVMQTLFMHCRLRVAADAVIDKSTFVPNINLINSNFSIKQAIDLDKLFEVLTSCKWIAMLNRRTHSGVNIPLKMEDGKVIKIMIFTRGNIIITAAKTSEHLFEGYKRIVEFLDSKFSEISRDGGNIEQKDPNAPPKKRGRKRKADTLSAYAGIVI